MEIEKLLLTARERANIDGLGRIDPHSLKRGVMRNRRNNQPPAVFKADEAAIEQVIDARRQQQSVLIVPRWSRRAMAYNGSRPDERDFDIQASSLSVVCHRVK